MDAFDPLQNLSGDALSFMKNALDLTDSSAIDRLHAQTLAQAEDEELPEFLDFVANIFWDRYMAGNCTTDLDRAISTYERLVRLTADFDPEQPARLAALGVALWIRFENTGHMSDIDTACFCFEGSLINGPSGVHTYNQKGNLGAALLARAGHSKTMSDLTCAITYLQQVLETTPEEIPNRAGYMNNLGIALEIRFNELGELCDLEAAVAANQSAIKLAPVSHPSKAIYFNNLGASLIARFNRLGEVPDLEAAVIAKQSAVSLTTDSQRGKAVYLHNLGAALETRFHLFGELSDLQTAVDANRKAINLTPDDHPNKAAYLNALGITLSTRFERTEEISDLQEAVASNRNAVDISPDDHPNRAAYLSCLGSTLQMRFAELGTHSDIECAVILLQSAVDLTNDGHPRAPQHFSKLGNALRTRFECIGDISDIEAAIEVLQHAVDVTVDGHPDKLGRFNIVGRALEARFRLHGNVSDLRRAIQGVSIAAEPLVGSPHVRMKAAYQWRRWGIMANDRKTTLSAYDCIISLIPRVAWMGLTMEGRHWHLEQVGDLVGDAAAAAIECGEHDIALEWLEQGRSVVWGQTLNLWSPLDVLRARDPARAARLTAISLGIGANSGEELTTESARDRIRTLSLEWDELVAEVRRTEGFEDFLGPKKVVQLIPAASAFPIVVLNAHEGGCEALVLKADAYKVIHVPLKLTSHRAKTLLDTMEAIKSQHPRGRSVEPVFRGFRIIGSERGDPDKVMMSMLAELWNVVVKPVLDALAFSLPSRDSENLPRICWCPTGPLIFLPIHAAGLYDTNERGTKVFDFVVSSYTPTVSALLRKPTPTPHRTRFLSVALAQRTKKHLSALPGTRTEIQLLGQRVRGSSVDLVVVEDKAVTVQHVLEEIKKCHWIHLACHGTQDLDSPTKSAFILADSNLELAEIIKHPLPHAQFAFLSACETATGDVKLAEEAVHLAAGMMLAGYCSVIATMWSILDKDGPGVADALYSEMLKDGKADHTRAAYALHRAVQKLRLSGAPFTAWMPFIHMGR